MLTKGLATCALVIAIASIVAAYTQVSALHLRQDQQPMYWSRYNTRQSGVYRDGVWVPLPIRSRYTSFQGGASGVGK
ncbi:MAG: hypothetical protein F6K30_15875 [Cyanothece sp. SIO2G6]|nr:hypothetical protein [Cyanothece sp. SIO2G6]